MVPRESLCYQRLTYIQHSRYVYETVTLPPFCMADSPSERWGPSARMRSCRSKTSVTELKSLSERWGPSVSRRSCRSKTSVTELLHVLEGGDPPEPCPHLMMTQQPRPW
jgi:hypothetical protein